VGRNDSKTRSPDGEKREWETLDARKSVHYMARYQGDAGKEAWKVIMRKKKSASVRDRRGPGNESARTSAVKARNPHRVKTKSLNGEQFRRISANIREI